MCVFSGQDCDACLERLKKCVQQAEHRQIWGVRSAKERSQGGGGAPTPWRFWADLGQGSCGLRAPAGAGSSAEKAAK